MDDIKDTVVIGQNAEGQPVNAAGEVVDLPHVGETGTENHDDADETATDRPARGARKARSQLPDNQKLDSEMTDIPSLPIAQGIAEGEQQAENEVEAELPNHVQARTQS